MNQTLTFLSWVRDSVSALATAQAGGRLDAAATITLSAKGVDGGLIGSVTRSLPFQIAGPADVMGLLPGAIVRRYPSPGVLDHESDRCPYIEMAEMSLPWRYTPAPTPAADSPNLHPWLVLLVGEEATELTLRDDTVTIDSSIQTGAHAIGEPSTPYRFAHVQADAAQHRITRVLCGRPLRPGTDYLAVVVPAYDVNGARAWNGSGPATVPVYDAWRFRTAVPAGSFEDLAARLRPGEAPSTTGRAPVTYPRVVDAPELEIAGALVAVAPGGPVAETPLPPAVANDLAALRLPTRDPEGRPIVALPRYGDAWNSAAPQAAKWGRALNDDPRRRGVAGLGLEIGIRFQDDLVNDVMAHLGALQEARQRVRHAVMGVVASRSLWRRRVPADPVERLWMLGPSLRRLVTSGGTVADLATGEDRTIARGTFSAAARRVLRRGPARTRLAASTPTPAAVVEAANKPPVAPPSTIDGLPLDPDALRSFNQARRQTLQAGRVDAARLIAAAADLVSNAHQAVQAAATELVTAIREASTAGRAVPWGQALTMLAASDARVVERSGAPLDRVEFVRRELSDLGGRIAERADDRDLTELIGQLSALEPGDAPRSPIDIATLASGMTAAFDPSTARPPVIERVLSTIEGGIDPAQPLAPPEPCVGLDRAVWADVARVFDEWLLPGIGRLPSNAVVSLETNPVFTDALLAGANTQLLTELRWRNIPVATGCTPLRRFWDRADTESGDRVDDITGIRSWTDQSVLGDPTHRAPGAFGRELVIAVRGDLFRRYPSTIVYLTSAKHGTSTTPDFDVDPEDAAPRILPGFQGRLGEDVSFFGFPGLSGPAVSSFWVVFEEPPAGYRFANDIATSASSGHAWAAATLAQPTRVLIRGDSLITGGA
jgi:hypothetical protein